MVESLRRLILRLLKVPPEPQAPEGTPGSVVVFRAGKNFYRWQVLMWGLSHVAIVVGAVTGFATMHYVSLRLPEWARTLWELGEIGGLAAFLVMPVTYIALRWNYELRWYIVTDRSLRIRRGVWAVEEFTMTFANIQEIRVKSGPIQNWLGLADVQVHAAGGSVKQGPHGPMGAGNLAAFEGVDNANEIRDFLVERLRQYRDSGLGDSRTPVAAAGAAGASDGGGGGGHEDIGAAAALGAARAVLAESRALRAAMGAGAGA